MRGRKRQEGQKANARLPRLTLLLFLPLLPLISACELTEVTVAPGQRVVVVQSVIDRNRASQLVIVEYSETGDAPGDTGFTVMGPGIPRIPIGGARVTIEHVGNGACAGVIDTLPEVPRRGGGASGLYGGSVCLPQPGQQLSLRVETPTGELVTGSTTVPGASTRQVTWGDSAAFNRALDTLAIGVTAVSGQALQVEARNSADLNDLTFFALTDTLGMTVAGNLVNPFEGDSGQTVFRAGRDYTLAVALTDSNYYDFVRSRSDPFTGRGFINHLAGGIGVFGSVETAEYDLHVVAPLRDPREGVYRIIGTIDALNVDATLELYLDDVQRYQFSAFVRNWPVGGGSTLGTLSCDGVFPLNPTGEMDFRLTVFAGDSLRQIDYQFTGARQPAGTPFPLVVRTSFPNRLTGLVDTLSALQISGPSASPRR